MKMMISTALVLGLSSATAMANASAWSSPASGCVVEPAGTALASQRAIQGDVHFATGQTGTIRLSCPIHGFGTQAVNDPDHFLLTFYDTDATTDNCTFKASFLRQNTNATEGGATIATYDGAADTTLASSSPFRNAESLSFTHTWNFDTNYYWVEVELFRNTTACDIDFIGVERRRPS